MDSKVSQLSTGVPSSADLITFVDVEDPSMAVSGTTKKATLAALLSSVTPSAGSWVSTADTGTVTNTMLAGSISFSKLAGYGVDFSITPPSTTGANIIAAFPNTGGTIILTGNTNIITSTGTVTSGTWASVIGAYSMVTPVSDVSAVGPTCSDFNAGYGSPTFGDIVYLDSAATWQKANATNAYDGLLAVMLNVISGSLVRVALPGSIIYAAAAFPTFTKGLRIYLSETAGAVTHTAPTTTDAAVRTLGWAVHADKMYFNPSAAFITRA